MSDKTNVCLLRELIHRFSEKTDIKIKICSNFNSGRPVYSATSRSSVSSYQPKSSYSICICISSSFNKLFYISAAGRRLIFLFTVLYTEEYRKIHAYKNKTYLPFFFFLFSSCFRVSAVETYLSAAITIKPSGDAGRCRASGHI